MHGLDMAEDAGCLGSYKIALCAPVGLDLSMDLPHVSCEVLRQSSLEVALIALLVYDLGVYGLDVRFEVVFVRDLVVALWALESLQTALLRRLSTPIFFLNVSIPLQVS